MLHQIDFRHAQPRAESSDSYTANLLYTHRISWNVYKLDFWALLDEFCWKILMTHSHIKVGSHWESAGCLFQRFSASYLEITTSLLLAVCPSGKACLFTLYIYHPYVSCRMSFFHWWTNIFPITNYFLLSHLSLPTIEVIFACVFRKQNTVYHIHTWYTHTYMYNIYITQ